MHCSCLISLFYFHNRVHRMPIWSSTCFTSSVFNRTLLCLVQCHLIISAGLLRRLPWLLCGGLSSVPRKRITLRQISTKCCFFWVQKVSILNQDVCLIYMIHNWGSGNTDVCIGKHGNQSQHLARAGIYCVGDGIEYFGMIYYSKTLVSRWPSSLLQIFQPSYSCVRIYKLTAFVTKNGTRTWKTYRVLQKKKELKRNISP